MQPSCHAPVSVAALAQPLFVVVAGLLSPLGVFVSAAVFVSVVDNVALVSAVFASPAGVHTMQSTEFVFGGGLSL